MQTRVAWKSVACSLALFAVLCAFGAPSYAGLSIINDDPDPVGGNTVQIQVANDSGQAERAVVAIQVALASGKSAVSEQAVNVPANGSVSVVATFGKPVSSVIAVGIIEGPDPIPQ